MRRAAALAALLAFGTLLPPSAGAQEPVQAQAPAPLAVGATAPDFSLVGATREGVLPAPLRLGDLRDQTVVIAFFYRAKTRG